MTQQQAAKTISTEDTLKRVNTVRYVFLAALMFCQHQTVASVNGW